jgi:hypothetical protein
MAWVTCPHCGFTQIPAGRCLKCKKAIERTPAAEPGTAAPGAGGGANAASGGGFPGLGAIPRVYVLGFAALALAIITGVLVWGSRASVSTDLGPPPTQTTPEPWSLDLTGRWQGRVTTTIAGTPSRPALRELFVETDRSGNVVAAGATLTDPGRGGAGAGYLTVPDGGRRVRELAAALGASPSGASLTLDFIPYAPWVPQRERSWRAVEGLRKAPDEVTYLLLESREPDYLIQAGVNATGFLSYLYLSPAYASGRGTDVLSKVIHPGPESSLRGFRNLVWDLSGSADFVSLQVTATISGPAGAADRVLLRRQ